MTATLAGRAVPEPKEGRWPGLHDMPRSVLRARVARAIFSRAVARLNLRVHLPGGQRLGGGGPRAPIMRIDRDEDFFRRVGRSGLIGFGESYMVGDWDAEPRPDGLVGVLKSFADRLTTLVPAPLQKLRRWYDARHPDGEDNSVRGARENIHRHYDLSNELFGLFLDETMTYSSAWFAPGEDSLADAQRRKLDGILDLAGVRAGSRLLEIGTGWGSLAIRAAQRGATVTSLTISGEQQRLARQRIAAAGLSDRVDVQLRDYREADGRYDAVASVEMIEAVGGEYWPVYFGAIDRMLAPGGRVGIQAITMAHDRMLATRPSYTWVHKYIFPGGLIPSLTAIDQTLREHTTLRVCARRDLGAHYAETLRHWRERFLSRCDDVRRLGFDQVFGRMWEFYLAYCEAGFRARYLGVSQLGLARP